MHISELFCIGEKGHSLYDFIDVDLDTDNRLFIDPALISLGTDAWSIEARECIDSFFDALFVGFKEDNIGNLLSHAHEQNATKLGYGQNGLNGKGKTPEGLDECLKNLKQLVQQIPTISQCEDVPVLIEGFAEDCMSDLLTNILHEQLNTFTASQMHKYGILPNCTKTFFTWSKTESKWVEVCKPCWAYKDREFLLVPKWIVRKNYLFKAHQYLMVVIIERVRAEQLKDDFTKIDIWRSMERQSEHWEYEKVISYTREHPDALADYHNKMSYYYHRANGQMSDRDLDICVYGNRITISA